MATPAPHALIPLRGPEGEPVSWVRTLDSHGVAHLPPNTVDLDRRTLTTTLTIPDSRPRTVVLSADGDVLAVRVLGRGTNRRIVEEVTRQVRRMLHLDTDLSGFYTRAAADPDLAWAAAGAGRLLQAPTVFRDVITTICTTNCTWAVTVGMVTRLVAHLGVPAAGTGLHAFPTPQAMARQPLEFYRDVIRAGYRGPHLKWIATEVARGRLDLERLATTPREELPDEEVERALLALPGVGPYAAAHIMMLLGRWSRPVLDSWSRPTYARLVGAESVADAEVLDRFAPYGDHAGLAFWLYCTRDWVPEGT